MDAVLLHSGEVNNNMVMDCIGSSSASGTRPRREQYDLHYLYQRLRHETPRLLQCIRLAGVLQVLLSTVTVFGFETL